MVGALLLQQQSDARSLFLRTGQSVLDKRNTQGPSAPITPRPPGSIHFWCCYQCPRNVRAALNSTFAGSYTRGATHRTSMLMRCILLPGLCKGRTPGRVETPVRGGAPPKSLPRVRKTRTCTTYRYACDVQIHRTHPTRLMNSDTCIRSYSSRFMRAACSGKGPFDKSWSWCAIA